MLGLGMYSEFSVVDRSDPSEVKVKLSSRYDGERLFKILYIIIDF